MKQSEEKNSITHEKGMRLTDDTSQWHNVMAQRDDTS